MSYDSGKTPGLPGFVALTLVAHLSHLGASLYMRTNLLSLLYGSTRAITEAEGKKISVEDTGRIESIKECIGLLRKSYEPIMDDPDSATIVLPKRIAYETKLDGSLEDLMLIIHRYKLVDASLMKPIEGRDWGQLL